MITTTCNQYTARRWFKLRTPINLGVVFVGFVILVFIFQDFIHPLIVDVIAVGMAYAAFFHILNRRVIAIECPSCKGLIETNTPWKCGSPTCERNNEQVDDFPFVNCCQHCGVEQKAYECHHCGEIIYLSLDKLKTICATLVKPPKTPEPEPPPTADPAEEKKAKRDQEKRDMEHEIEMARLEAKLKEARERAKGSPKEKTAEEELAEFYASYFGVEEAARMMKAQIDKDYPNDRFERERRYRIVDDWVTSKLDR